MVTMIDSHFPVVQECARLAIGRGLTSLAAA
jgi:hypothetical protein